MDGWERDDKRFVDELQKKGCQSQNLTTWPPCPTTSCTSATTTTVEAISCYLLETFLSCFDVSFFKEMADEMQCARRERGDFVVVLESDAQRLTARGGNLVLLLAGLQGIS